MFIRNEKQFQFISEWQKPVLVGWEKIGNEGMKICGNKSNWLSLAMFLWRHGVPHAFLNAKLLILLEHESVSMALHRLHQTLTVRALKGQWQGWEVENFDLLFSSVCSKKSMSFSSCDSTRFFNPHSQFLSMEGVILASCVCFLFCSWIKCFSALITKSEEKRECVFL